jgi:hypothetical protein
MLKTFKEFKLYAMNLGALYWLLQRIAPKYWALAAFVGSTYFMTVLFTLHFLRTDLDPYATPVSWYRLSDTSGYLASGFFLAGAGEIILAALLPLAFRNVSGWGRLFLFLAGAGIFMLGVQREGTIHLMGALFQAMFFPIGVLMLGDAMEIGFYKRLCQVFSTATLTLFPLMVIAFDGNSVLHPYFGLLEKITIIVMMTWSGVVLHEIYRQSKNIEIFKPRKLTEHEFTC